MNQLPNLLSALRIPLALAFLQQNPYIRACSILAACATDFLDGFLARRLKHTSPFGTLLDPFSDKFYVGSALLALYIEGTITSFGILCMLSRDIALLLFTVYLILKGKWATYRIRAFLSGKAATAVQLAVLFWLSIGGEVSPFAYYTLALLGLSSLTELIFLERQNSPL